jgi:predicted ATPase
VREGERRERGGEHGVVTPPSLEALTPERWQAVKRIVEDLLERASEQRAERIAQACGSDAALRREVESLLAAASDATPAFDVIAAGASRVQELLRQPGSDTANAESAGQVAAKMRVALDTALAGRYVVERELGRGGMAVVFLARDLRHRRRVALKVLHPRHGAVIGPIRFRREIETAAGLSHPHILPLFDSGDADGLLYYVMPHVGGGSLRERLLREGPLPTADVLRVVREIAGALDHAHRHGVVHRDVKPENVLIDEGGHALVSDFGIARAMQDDAAGAPDASASQKSDTTLTEVGVAIGTPAYMSPEQILGARDIDGRSDVYALGCVAFELLTAERAFPPSRNAIAERLLGHGSPSLAVHRPDLPATVDRVLQRALALNRADRPASAADFVRALADSLAVTLEGAAASTAAPSSVPHNLPGDLTPLFGRERELAEAESALRRGRLLTLTGPGGIGKTRLAVQLAERVLDLFRDGVFFVALAPLSDSDLLIITIVEALGVRQLPTAAGVESLSAHLRDRQVLLVLDNFEQLVTSAPLIIELLNASPGTKALVTSRTRLNVTGERELVVPPLALPDPKHIVSADALLRYPASALFCARARSVNPQFELSEQNVRVVAEICTRLEGLPLAIELAAGRSKLLPPPVLLRRLESRLSVLSGGARDLPLKQQTMRGAIAWSYDLLSEAEKAVFRRVSVFVAGFTMDAAEAVCRQPNHASTDVLEALASLVDKSLLRSSSSTAGDEVRFDMLETIREYAQEQLGHDDDSVDVPRRHAEYHLRLAEQAEPFLVGPQEAAWMDRVEAEHNNLRAALTWYLENDDSAEGAFRLGGALLWFWFVQGHLAEGVTWLERVLKRTGAVPIPMRIKVLAGASFLAYVGGLLPRAREWATEGLALTRRDQSTSERIMLLSTRGLIALGEEKHDVARAVFKEGLRTAAQTRDKFALGLLFNVVGEWKRSTGDLDGARSAYERALALGNEVGSMVFQGVILSNLGAVALAQGDLEAAQVFHQEALRNAQRTHTAIGIATALEGLAGVLVAAEKPARAARLLGAASVVRETAGHPVEPPDRDAYERAIAIVRQGLGDGGFSAEWTHGRVMTQQEAVAYGLETIGATEAP